MQSLFEKFRTDESGATAIEYSLILALIALMLVTALSLVRDEFANVIDEVIVGLKG